MLRGIRKASSNWIGKTIMTIVMGVLIVSFGVWGIADIFKGYGQSSLATIGKTEISTDQFRQIYMDRLQQIGRQFGRPLTTDQARAFGLDRQVLQTVIQEAALDEDARRMGLAQSNEETMRIIMADPNFRGPNGQFDAGRFAATIRNVGYTEQRYVAEQRKIGLRRQIATTMNAGVEPPKAMVDAVTSFRSEERTIEFVKLDAAQAGTIEAPTAEALAAYYEDHKFQFRSPEYRKIAFVVVTPDEIAKWSTVSDDEARKAYESNKDKLAVAEKREVSQLFFSSVEEAQAAREKIKGGATFEDVAKERGKTTADTDLGSVTKSAIVDPAVADAAFALKTGEVSEPVKGRFGTILVKVGAITPGSVPSFEQVAPDIRRDLARQDAVAKVADLHNKMEDERGGGANVVDAAKKLGLNAVTVDAVDRSGRGPDGNLVAAIPQGTNIVSQAFNSDVGVETETINFNGGYIWFDVLAITPARERPLDEVKAEVEAKWRESQVTTRLRTKAAEMVKAIEGGATLADQAAAAGLKIETPPAFKRDADVTGLPGLVNEVAFRTAKDAVGQTQGSGNEWYVFRVTGVTIPPVDQASDEVKKLKDTLDRALSEEQITQYISSIEKRIGVSVNQSAVAQVTGAGS